MTDYDGEEQMSAAAQSCRQFNTRGAVSSRFNTDSSGLSCSMCRSWDGSQCVKNVFDAVLTNVDIG